MRMKTEIIKICGHRKCGIKRKIYNVAPLIRKKEEAWHSL